MHREEAFWPVDSADSATDLWVCMSCLSEVYWRKVPIPDCPTCHGVSTYEAFTLDSIRDWGTDELIAKAVAAEASTNQPSVQATGRSEVEPTE